MRKIIVAVVLVVFAAVLTDRYFFAPHRAFILERKAGMRPPPDWQQTLKVIEEEKAEERARAATQPIPQPSP